MSIENYEASVVAKSLYGLLLKEGEKGKLYEICNKYSIPITYPSLFNDDTHYYFWGIRKCGIGLVGVFILKYLSENGTVFYSLNELEEYLKGGSL